MWPPGCSGRRMQPSPTPPRRPDEIPDDRDDTPDDRDDIPDVPPTEPPPIPIRDPKPEGSPDGPMIAGARAAPNVNVASDF